MGSICDFAVDVLKKEAESIIQSIPCINQDFTNAVKMIKDCRGKVLATGVGKSGNIAAKIASTLASTGTPSFFLHPTDASHGDLGTIGKDDIILALSNSGETVELINIIRYANRFSIKLISMVSNAQSTLAKESNVAIVIPKLIEAGALNIAPTSSTTAMLAVGDALALCVCQEKQFTLNNFKTLHPGGAIGRKLLKVSDIMRTGIAQIPLASPGTPLNEVIQLISDKGEGCIAIINEFHEVIGVVTDGDVRRAFDIRHFEPSMVGSMHAQSKESQTEADKCFPAYGAQGQVSPGSVSSSQGHGFPALASNLYCRTAGEIMSKHPILISKNDLAVNALKIMSERLITNLPVINSESDKRLVGILHILDCIKYGIA